jgi:hypothetical protein
MVSAKKMVLTGLKAAMERNKRPEANFFCHFTLEKLAKGLHFLLIGTKNRLGKII